MPQFSESQLEAALLAAFQANDEKERLLHELELDIGFDIPRPEYTDDATALAKIAMRVIRDNAK